MVVKSLSLFRLVWWRTSPDAVAHCWRKVRDCMDSVREPRGNSGRLNRNSRRLIRSSYGYAAIQSVRPDPRGRPTVSVQSTHCLGAVDLMFGVQSTHCFGAFDELFRCSRPTVSVRSRTVSPQSATVSVQSPGDPAAHPPLHRWGRAAARAGTGDCRGAVPRRHQRIRGTLSVQSPNASLQFDN